MHAGPAGQVVDNAHGCEPTHRHRSGCGGSRGRAHWLRSACPRGHSPPPAPSGIVGEASCGKVGGARMLRGTSGPTTEGGEPCTWAETALAMLVTLQHFSFECGMPRSVAIHACGPGHMCRGCSTDALPIVWPTMHASMRSQLCDPPCAEGRRSVDLCDLRWKPRLGFEPKAVVVDEGDKAGGDL